VGLAACFGDRDEVGLAQDPGERDLGRSGFVALRDFFERGAIEQIPATANRRVAHDRDPVLLAPWKEIELDPALAEVIENLVRRATCAGRQCAQLLHIGEVEIRNAPVADFSRGPKSFERCDGFGNRDVARRPMEQVKINRVDTQPTKTAFARLRQFCARSVMRVGLAHDEDALTLAFDRLRHHFLCAAFAVHFGGVDERQAEFNPEAQRGHFFVVGALLFADAPGALSERRNAGAVGQGKGFHLQS
jgi:hypothetical protein